VTRLERTELPRTYKLDEGEVHVHFALAPSGNPPWATDDAWRRIYNDLVAKSPLSIPVEAMGHDSRTVLVARLSSDLSPEQVTKLLEKTESLIADTDTSYNGRRWDQTKGIASWWNPPRPSDSGGPVPPYPIG
jgi:hypothetical protein